MKKTFILFLLAVMCAVAANADTKYEINVAGVEVTSDHCYIRVGDSDDIESGYAVYTPSNNTLTCYGLKIYRSGNGNYGIHNRKCDNLKIVFKGGYNRVASADHALNLARSTTIDVEDGSEADIYTGGDSHALNLGSYNYYIQGAGGLLLNGKNAIHGNGSGSTTVYFQGAEVYARSDLGSNKRNHALESFKAVFNEGANLKIEANENMTSVNNTSMYFYGREKILEPFGAYYSNSAIYDSSGSQITDKDIYISDNYVAIVNQDYFPDLNFRIEVRNLFPKGYITSTDVASTKKITLYNKAISNLEGLQYFTELTEFYCRNNNITTLPISALTKLEVLDCGYNKITSLTITGRSALKKLYVNDNPITLLNCSNNALTDLSVMSCTSLTAINCANNNLSNVNFSWCESLKTLDCKKNQFTTSGLGTLPSSLEALDCSHNKLSSLDVRSLKKLATLHAHSNGMTSFSGTNCSALKELWVCYNNLTSLDLTGCSALRELWIQKNQIKGAAMTSLINTLRSIPTSESEGLLSVFEPSSSLAEGNQITNAQIMAARAKRWIPKQYNYDWQEIALKGDVNGDGKINVSDVTALVNMILGVIPKDLARGDINGDGNVNVSDVTALVNIILGQN